MSGRHRQVKRRIRDVEDTLDSRTDLIDSYADVIADIKASDIDEHSIAMHILRMRECALLAECDRLRDELRYENELLATMPKSLGVSPHDAGDEHTPPQAAKGK